MTTEQPKVEEQREKEENQQSSDDEQEGHEHEHLDPSKKGNKGQKKFKKAMGKMGLKPFSGINRITIKKGKAFVISIDDPDVWKSPGNENAYIVFGKPNLDGMQQQGETAFKDLNTPVNPEGLIPEQKTELPAQTDAPKQEEEQAEDLNEEGISPDNIKMVMEYTKCSKTEAIRALRETEDDSVNAIMKLTK